MKPEQLVGLAKKWAKQVAERMKFSDVEELESLALAEAWELVAAGESDVEVARKVENKLIAFVRKEMYYARFKAEKRIEAKKQRLQGGHSYKQCPISKIDFEISSAEEWFDSSGRSGR